MYRLPADVERQRMRVDLGHPYRTETDTRALARATAYRASWAVRLALAAIQYAPHVTEYYGVTVEDFWSSLYFSHDILFANYVQSLDANSQSCIILSPWERTVAVPGISA